MVFLYFGAFILCRWTIVLASTPQPNVLSDSKSHALFIWIHLKDGADMSRVIRSVAKLHSYIEEVCTKDTCKRVPEEEILAGVGFGYELYSQATANVQRNYSLSTRRGFLGDLPSTGGDIFVHAKSNSHSKLFELSQAITRNLPTDSISLYKDIYGFQYKGNRDLSGFVDGTENPSSATRFAIAVNPETNGSYCLTQEWIHNLTFINSQPASSLESFVGRKLSDSDELHNKTVSSHVARMTSGPEPEAKKPFEIYRQSMPYGTVGGSAGLFFIAFSSSTDSFDFMLSRMVGKTAETSDDIMRLSRCVAGNYWYFPSMEELRRLQNAIPASGNAFHARNPPITSNSIDSDCQSLQRSSLPSSAGINTYHQRFICMVVGVIATFGKRL